MKIKERYQGSQTKRLIDFLFSPAGDLIFSNTLMGRNLARIKSPRLSLFFTFFASTLIIYESLVTRVLKFDTSIPGLMILFLAFIFANKDNFSIIKSFWWYLVFIVFACVSSLWAIFQGIDSRILIFGLIIFFQFGLVLIVGYLQKKEIITKFFSWSVLPAALYGIYQFLTRLQTGKEWLLPSEEITTRAFSFFGSPNILGILIAVSALVSFLVYVDTKKYSYLILLGIYLFALFATFSRTAWLAFGIGFIISACIVNTRYLLLAPASAILLLFNNIRERILVAFGFEYQIDSALDGRLWAINNGTFIFKKHPLLGTGLGSYGGRIAQNYSSPIYHQGIQNGYVALYFTDNQWLELLVQTGILGVLTFAGFIVSSAAQIIFNFQKSKKPIYLSGLAVLIALFVAGFGANVLEFGAVAVPAGLIIGSCLNEN